MFSQTVLQASLQTAIGLSRLVTQKYPARCGRDIFLGKIKPHRIPGTSACQICILVWLPPLAGDTTAGTWQKDAAITLKNSVYYDYIWQRFSFQEFILGLSNVAVNNRRSYHTKALTLFSCICVLCLPSQELSAQNSNGNAILFIFSWHNFEALHLISMFLSGLGETGSWLSIFSSLLRRQIVNEWLWDYVTSPVFSGRQAFWPSTEKFSQR
jgi:hypothetical protein